jgi:cell division protein FtsA
MHPSQSHLPPVFGLLDVGTAKVVCLMLAQGDDGIFRLIGLGHQTSRGLKASVVVDADAAEAAVRAAVEQAQHMAGTALEYVVMSAACGRLNSTHFAASLDLEGRATASADLDSLMRAGRRHTDRDERGTLYLEALGARLDGIPVPGKAVGRSGHRLTLDMHAVTVDRAPMRHLVHIAERCNLHVLAVAPAPLASGLAVTTTADREDGALVIDCGAGTTGMALFVRGTLVASHVFQVGGNHLTYDLTRALDTTINEAERIKKKYAIDGLAHSVPTDTIAYQARGDTHPNCKQVTRATMTTTLTSRLDALLQQVAQRLELAAVPADFLRHVLLTGGGSQLPLMAARAGAILRRPVRTAAPLSTGLWPQSLIHPAFATVAGLLELALDPDMGMRLGLVPIPIESSASQTAWYPHRA